MLKQLSRRHSGTRISAISLLAFFILAGHGEISPAHAAGQYGRASRPRPPKHKKAMKLARKYLRENATTRRPKQTQMIATTPAVAAPQMKKGKLTVVEPRVGTLNWSERRFEVHQKKGKTTRVFTFGQIKTSSTPKLLSITEVKPTAPGQQTRTFFDLSGVQSKASLPHVTRSRSRAEVGNNARIESSLEIWMKNMQGSDGISLYSTKMKNRASKPGDHMRANEPHLGSEHALFKHLSAQLSASPAAR
jgi:hypothetical protein